MKVVKDKILVEPIKQGSIEEQMTSGGIYIPIEQTSGPLKGKVINIGKDVKEIKVGDTIAYRKSSGWEITVLAKDYVVMKEDEILVIIGRQEQVETN